MKDNDILKNSINQKIEDLGLKIIGNKQIKINLKHRSILIPCRVKDGEKKLIFRVLFFKNKFSIFDFKKEVVFYEFLNKNKIKTPFKVTRLFSSGMERGFGWMIREYIEGKALGAFEGAGFSSSFFTKSNLCNIIDSIKFIQGLTKDFLKFGEENGIKTPERKYIWYKNNFKKTFSKDFEQRFSESIKNNLNPEERKKFSYCFTDNKNLLNNSCQYLSHGDMHPGNIFNAPKKFLIIDWEEVHINNPLYDAAFIWIYSWQNEKWRDLFLEKFLEQFKANKQKRYKKLFYVIVLRVIFRNIVYLEDSVKKGDKDKIFIQQKHLSTVKNIINCKL